MRILLVLVLVTLVACETVPISGRSQLVLIPEGTEVKMGLTSYQEIIGKSKLSTDARANEQLARVGRRIADATGRTDYQWEFKVIEDPQVNAFCLPGGKVAVYTGILPVAHDDAGLAAVVGHEVSHAIARHGGERMSQQLAVRGISLAAAATLPITSGWSTWPRPGTTLTPLAICGRGWQRPTAADRSSYCPPIRCPRPGSPRSRGGSRRP